MSVAKHSGASNKPNAFVVMVLIVVASAFWLLYWTTPLHSVIYGAHCR